MFIGNIAVNNEEMWRMMPKLIKLLTFKVKKLHAHMKNFRSGVSANRLNYAPGHH
jgi:hypothetical protein